MARSRGLLSIPKYYKGSSPNSHVTQAIYATQPEIDLLRRVDMHNSGIGRENHYGPGGLLNMDGGGGCPPGETYVCCPGRCEKTGNGGGGGGGGGGDKCKGVDCSCPPGQEGVRRACNPQTGSCSGYCKTSTPVDKCKGVNCSCPPGQEGVRRACNPATGSCSGYCQAIDRCRNVDCSCPPGQEGVRRGCNPATGGCSGYCRDPEPTDPCDGVDCSCPDGQEGVRRGCSNGSCVGYCRDIVDDDPPDDDPVDDDPVDEDECGPGKPCSGPHLDCVNGECKPVNGGGGCDPACDPATEKCENGNCVPKTGGPCDNKTCECPSGTTGSAWCDPDTGDCNYGGCTPSECPTGQEKVNGVCQPIDRCKGKNLDCAGTTEKRTCNKATGALGPCPCNTTTCVEPKKCDGNDCKEPDGCTAPKVEYPAGSGTCVDPCVSPQVRDTATGGCKDPEVVEPPDEPDDVDIETILEPDLEPDLMEITDEMDLQNVIVDLLNTNSPLWKAARTRAMQSQASRGGGRLNSSMLDGAITQELITTVVPIANGIVNNLKEVMMANVNASNAFKAALNAAYYQELLARVNNAAEYKLNLMKEGYAVWAKILDAYMAGKELTKEQWERYMAMLDRNLPCPEGKARTADGKCVDVAVA